MLNDRYFVEVESKNNPKPQLINVSHIVSLGGSGKAKLSSGEIVKLSEASIAYVKENFSCR